MNIFILHEDPITAAQMQCDKHVVKMILEGCQMLSTVHHRYLSKAPYKATHMNHPCTLWAGTNQSNYVWLSRHTLALCEEYSFRYYRQHKCEELLIDGLFLPPKGIPVADQTPFAQAMPDKYKNKNAVTAYRNYYIGEKMSFAKWTKRQMPSWFEDAQIALVREYCS